MPIFLLLITSLFLLLLGYSGYKSFYIPYKINKLASMINSDEIENAIINLKKILVMDESNLQARWYLALGYKNMGQYILAIKEFNIILKMGKFSKQITPLSIHKEQAHLYKLTNNYNKMIAEYINISRLDPNDFEANFNLGFHYFKNNNFSLAMDACKKARNAEPFNPDVNFLLGELYFIKNDYDSAEEVYKITIKSTPGHIKANFRLGIIELSRKNYEKALDIFKKLENNKEISDELYYYMGKLYEEIGETDYALQYLEKAERYIKDDNDKRSLDIRYSLASLYKFSSRLSDAIEQWTKIYRISHSYLDVEEMLNHYKLMEQNKYLKLFSEAKDKDFRELCAKIVTSMEDKVEDIQRISEDRYIIIGSKDYNRTRIYNVYNIYRGAKPITKNDLIELNSMIMEKGYSTGYLITSAEIDQKAKQYIQAYSVLSIVDSQALTDRLRNIFEKQDD